MEIHETGCKNCGATPVPGHVFPLCAPCRERFTHGPLSPKIVAFLMGLFIVGVCGLIFRQGNLKGAFLYERGLKAERLHEFDKALDHFESALGYYPDSPRIILEMAWLQEKLGRKREALETLHPLAGRKLDKEYIRRANDIIDRLQGEK